MSYTMTKEKNIISFLADGKTTPYTFDVNTGIFYGLKKQPIKSYPPNFKKWIAENHQVSAVIGLLYTTWNYPNNITGNWLAIPLNELANYSDLFKVADKLDNIGYNTDNINYNKTVLKFINSHFKKFSKAFKENPNITLIGFYNNYNRQMWEEKNHLKPNGHLTAELIDKLYENRRYYPEDKTSYVVNYLTHGLLEFLNDTWGDSAFRKIQKYFE